MVAQVLMLLSVGAPRRGVYHHRATAEALFLIRFGVGICRMCCWLIQCWGS